MRTVKPIFASLLIFFVAMACQKTDLQSTSTDEVSLSQQETQAEVIANDVDYIVDEAVQNNLSQLKSASLSPSLYLSDCTHITMDTVSSPKVLTIDFGTGCTGKDGKTRAGKIIVTSTSFKTFPSVRTKTFQHFTVNGKKVEGTVVKTILRDQVNHIRTAAINEDISVTDSLGTAHRVASLTRKYDFNELGIRSDNEVTSWGTVQFTRVSGATVTKTIEESNPLVYLASCHHIVSGIVTIVTPHRTWSINYGTGNCDQLVTITVNGKSREIRLP
jgi:hypothetical protein